MQHRSGLQWMETILDVSRNLQNYPFASNIQRNEGTSESNVCMRYSYYFMWFILDASVDISFTIHPQSCRNKGFYCKGANEKSQF